MLRQRNFVGNPQRDEVPRIVFTSALSMAGSIPL